MNHNVYLGQKAKEFENLKSGEKVMIIRGAMDMQTSYGEVSVGDIFYFIENNDDSSIKPTAEVDKVFTSGQLTEEESIELTKKHQDKLIVDDQLL